MGKRHIHLPEEVISGLYKNKKKRERQNKTRREEFKIEVVVMAEKQWLTLAGLGKENHKDEDKYTPV